MRATFTIFRYEWAMMLRAKQYWVLLALTAFLCFAFYLPAIQRQDFQLGEGILNDEIFPVYLAAAILIGLNPIGRIRTTGMHPILMVRPFPTLSLMAGQWLACMAALLLPLNLLLFVPGSLLRHYYELEFPLLPVIYIELFYCLPMLGCVLALTLWVRTCFKNNLIALIILGGLFLAITVVAQKLIDLSGMEDAMALRFVPMLSYFSEGYYRIGIRQTLESGVVLFNRPADWLNLALSLLTAAIFLIMGGYHLRRTEPQRKILGTYGRHWYHAPTFLRVACDLKIDPHTGWRQHLALAGLIAIVVLRGGWSLAGDLIGPYSAWLLGRDAPQSLAGKETLFYSPEGFPEEKILPITIHADRQAIASERIDAILTFSIDGETSGRAAVLARINRYPYAVKQIALDDRPLQFRDQGVCIFIDGRQFEGYAPGERHRLTIAGVKDRQVGQPIAQLNEIRARGFYFIRRKSILTVGDGESRTTFDWAVPQVWPTTLELTMPATARLLDGPVQPTVREAGKNKVLRFEIPAALNGRHQRLLFETTGQYKVVARDGMQPDLRLIVPASKADIAADVLEVAQPALEDFRRLHHLRQTRPVWIPYYNLRQSTAGFAFLTLHRYRQQIRSHPYSAQWTQEDYFARLQSLQTEFMQRVYRAEFEPGCRFSFDSDFHDLPAFIYANLERGLNHNITRERSFLPLPFGCVNARMEPEAFARVAKKKRALHVRDRAIPIFQMLYLVLGHDRWQAMLDDLKVRLDEADFDDALLQAAAERAGGESLAWFFDYWLRDGEGFPTYKLLRADARMIEADSESKDASTRYEVEAEIQNIGSGRMPVPLVLQTSKQPVEERIWIGPGETVTWRTSSQNLPREIEIDPEGWIVRVAFDPQTGRLDNFSKMPVTVASKGI